MQQAKERAAEENTQVLDAEVKPLQSKVDDMAEKIKEMGAKVAELADNGAVLDEEAVAGLAFLDALIVLWHVGVLRWRRWRERV